MWLQKLRHWVGVYQPVLALTLVEQEARYLVRQGTRVLTQGSLSLPHAVQGGALLSVERLKEALLPKLPKLRGQVAILLPTRWLHLHEMTLPRGLNSEELGCQINRHITHVLGLSLSDVFYDWQVQSNATDKRTMNILLGIARQVDIAPFYHAFADTDWQIKWVCSEAQVWEKAHEHRNKQGQIAVCQVEAREMTFLLIGGQSGVRSFYKRFDEQQIAQAGFVYNTGASNASLQLPARFVAEELATLLPVWLGGGSLHDIDMLYITGKGMDAVSGLPILQARLGLPVRQAEQRISQNKFNEHKTLIETGLLSLYHLSKQVNE